jgi:zinc transport system substrate-binding protein
MRMILVWLLVLFALAGCASAGSSSDVVAAFYPLAFAAQTVGGPGLHVRNLTPAGAEPHDIELTPKDVAAVQKARLVIYVSHDFQPAVEEAVQQAHGVRLDAVQGLSLARGVGDESGKADPHVWLDPILYARIVRRIGAALGRPRAAGRLVDRLDALDREYRRGLRDCAQRTFVTSHAAFGYLAARYGLHQVAITGLDPEAEPSARRLASLAALVRRLGTNTVFFERLVSPKLAETVAREAGAHTAVLDPIEGLTHSESEHGASYLSLMRQNLLALRTALRCR